MKSYLPVNLSNLLLFTRKYKPDILSFLLAPELYIFHIVHQITDLADQRLKVTVSPSALATNAISSLPNFLSKYPGSSLVRIFPEATLMKVLISQWFCRQFEHDATIRTYYGFCIFAVSPKILQIAAAPYRFHKGI